MSLDVVSLFSGIGGIDLAFERAGCTTRFLCEIDTHAQKVLAHHWPSVPIHHDVTKVTADDLHAAGARPARTVLVAGFPCQDLSVAGRRRGMGEGTRSGLYWQIDRLLAEFRPAWVVLENVPGLLSSHGGRDMGAVLGSLAERSYGFAYRVLDSQYAGVPQRRRRVVIVGHLGGTGAAPAQILLEPESGGGDPAASVAARETDPGAPAWGAVRTVGALTSTQGGADDNDARAGHLLPVVFQKIIRSGARDENGDLPPEVWAERSVAATMSPFDLGSGSRAVELVVQPLAVRGPFGADQWAPAVAATLTAGTSGPNVSPPGRRQEDDSTPAASGTTVRRLTPLERERLQGMPDGWTAVDGMSDSQRYKQLGNGVAVPVFEWVARRLVSIDAQLTECAA